MSKEKISLLSIGTLKEKADRLPELAAELVRLKVDVIVTSYPVSAAAKNATKTIPIVFACCWRSGRQRVRC